MGFEVKDKLTEKDVQHGLNTVIRDGLATQAMVTLAGGAFMVAFAVKLGAPYTVIGLLAAIPPLMQLLQVPSIYLVEKYRVRKPIVVYSAAASRLFLLLIAMIPFLFSIELGLVFLLLALALHSAFGAVAGCGWNSWMRDLVPQDRLGAFFSRRMSLAAGLGIVLLLVGGFFIDLWKGTFPDYELYGYSILFFSAFIAGMIGIYFVSTIPEPRMALPKERMNFSKLISRPFRSKSFRNLLTFLGTWSFAVNLAAPFFIVYMLTRLQYDMSLIIGLIVLTQAMNLAFLRVWGKFSDRYSNKSVLGVSGPMFLFCIIAWTFTTLPEAHMFTLPLVIVIHALMGISLAGITLAAANIALKAAPKGQATSYLAANSIINSLAAGIAPIMGGVVADIFSGHELSWTLSWTSPGGTAAVQTLNFQHWDFLFFFAFVIGVYALHRLSLVKESGEVDEKIVSQELASELKRGVRNFSTAGGIQHMARFQYSATRTVLKPFVAAKTTIKKRRPRLKSKK